MYVYGFDFLEFLEIKGLNVKNLKLENISNFILEQIRPYFEEYLKFGSYPEVVLSTTEQEKKEKFNQIIEDYFFKDVKLFLSKSEFVDFKNNLKLLAEKV
jgi:predicted AAA+ superfamily ATPase